MPRFALKIEYHGAPFYGWQRQKDLPSVQGALENALRQLDAELDHVQGAGRTDTGVHSTGQVAHVDLVKDWDPYRLAEALNYHLKPLPVAIVACARAPADFHARFSANERRYVFRLQSRRAPMTIEKGLVWRLPYTLDTDRMRAGAAYLLGNHDFTTFRSSACQGRSPVKTLSGLDIKEIALDNGIEYQFLVRARSFLHNQVRSFVGTLERVGARAWTPEDVGRALAARDRAACGPVCPPHGLYLAEVSYPQDPFA